MVTPYLVFYGNCGKALDIYRSVFAGDDPHVMPYGDYVPEGLENPPGNLNEWVMHAEMEICGTKFWFADETQPVLNGNAVRLTATVPDMQTAQAVFDRLASGGQITLPPTETFYSTFHGSVTDRFGVSWNIVAEEAPGAKG